MVGKDRKTTELQLINVVSICSEFFFFLSLSQKSLEKATVVTIKRMILTK